ncbi:unnamed protein product [Arabidopsis lyrata]|uniref:zinc finger MYM-type protein 5-like n=1 Tax=Arabidopsis lyrata subsp. lyrata TaxID=81972 RepID=UPI000A29C259|nr:zinc finger MYM-type protein 5-like [Arabidopsis lyrata subsp. lyrata]XP_020885554.1 zinc finger MYM-type protein 5-like [Arabidopsis lyrata subsp. lyrata]CAH8263837.1 unnamed protein product [Arabidopsis lyrata]|eukprot:XP_020885553.1 zinc finger MYM-type protein 5-like [Arabidopsis lyrata subsp. lyrata]
MPPLSMKKEASGALKRKKRKKQQQFLKSQANAILKFVKKKPQSSSRVETVVGQSNVVPENLDECKEKQPENSSRVETVVDSSRINENIDVDDIGQSNVVPEHLDVCKEKQKRVVYQSKGSEERKKDVCEDISDPGNWGNVDMKLRDLLVENGPTIRLSTDYKFPKDSIGRHFSQAFYTREMVNGEKQDRRWLVYSETLDKVFCFCCKLFRHEKNSGGNLATTGYNNWKQLSTRLKEHENFHDHIACMTQWKELEVRLQKNQTIDKLFKF